MESQLAVVALEALAQESRLGIFRLLVQAGPEGMPAGRIAERMKLPAATLSFHLAQLRHAGLIVVRRNGRSLIYSGNFGVMNEVIAFLTENCCGGRPEMCVPGPVTCAPAKPKSKAKRKAK